MSPARAAAHYYTELNDLADEHAAAMRDEARDAQWDTPDPVEADDYYADHRDAATEARAERDEWSQHP